MTKTRVEYQAQQVLDRHGKSKVKREDTAGQGEKTACPSRTRKKMLKMVTAPCMALQVYSKWTPGSKTQISLSTIQPSVSTSDLHPLGTSVTKSCFSWMISPNLRQQLPMHLEAFLLYYQSSCIFIQLPLVMMDCLLCSLNRSKTGGRS